MFEIQYSGSFYESADSNKGETSFSKVLMNLVAKKFFNPELLLCFKMRSSGMLHDFYLQVTENFLLLVQL